MKSSEMKYPDVLTFIEEMHKLGYIPDKIDEWEIAGIGFTNKDKNIFILCFFDSGSMTVYPYVPSADKYKDTFDSYLDQFETVRNEINNAYNNLFSECEMLKKKYSNTFNKIEVIRGTKK